MFTCLKLDLFYFVHLLESIKNDRISSFTSSLDCADRFAKNKGYLIVVDTEKYLKYEEEIFKINGFYEKSFYLIFEVLKKS